MGFFDKLSDIVSTTGKELNKKAKDLVSTSKLESQINLEEEKIQPQKKPQQHRPQPNSRPPKKPQLQHKPLDGRFMSRLPVSDIITPPAAPARMPLSLRWSKRRI